MPMTTMAEKALLGYEPRRHRTVDPRHTLRRLAGGSVARQLDDTDARGVHHQPDVPVLSGERSLVDLQGDDGWHRCGVGPGRIRHQRRRWRTITDGTGVVTEVSTLFAAGTFTGAEPSAGAYARVAVTNNTTNWPAPTGDPAQVQNGTVVTFPTTTASWGQIAGFGLWDALTAGNARWWGLLTAASSSPP